MATRWGVAGCGRISRDFVTATKIFPKTEHHLVAVAARTLESAEKFQKEMGADKAYGSYAELAKDPDVDVVYVGVINITHFEVASLMINAGKHVLCEKPLCLTLKETQALVLLARQKKVFLMEAIWSRCFPLYKELQKRIDSGEIGEVVQVIATFGFRISTVPRVAEKNMGGGAILDLGIYTLQFVSLIMKGEKPTKLVATGHLNENGVDVNESICMQYSQGRVAMVSTTINAKLPNEAIVIGTKGSIKVHEPFWCPEVMDTPSGKFESLIPKNPSSFEFTNSQGLMHEAAEVRRCIQAGLLESPCLTLDESLLLSSQMDEIRRQMGVDF